MLNIEEVLQNYDVNNITIGVLGGHSALDVCAGAKKRGFRTVAVCQKGRDLTYSKYYKSREDGIGCIDEVILVDKFADVVKPEVQKRLRELNTIFIHNRYFWVYCNFEEIEKDFNVPIYGSRELVKLEERDHPNNQYVLLEKAGIRIPKIVRSGDSGFDEAKTRQALDKHFADGGAPLIVKVNEAIRSYERAFFIITSTDQYYDMSSKMIKDGTILEKDLNNAVIEEFVIGAQINFNFFYSPLDDSLEIMGTDTRRQTSLDGFLRLDAMTQTALITAGYKPSMVENGHIACTVKESILEKAFAVGEKFVKTLKKEVDPGIIGPFALQGAMSSANGKEEFVVFDVSMRIPGSPGTRFTPYSGYLYGESMSYGDRIALEVEKAVENGKIKSILT
jgi:5-formaminoimidazole-4-carboxamide-1-(beta)-D-ribofuranosyl 5'-monophosphate synthetase